MAVYKLENVDFELRETDILAKAVILKDAVPLQSFTVSLPIYKSAQELAAAVVKHAKKIVMYDAYTAEIFSGAEQWLEAQSWNYG